MLRTFTLHNDSLHNETPHNEPLHNESLHNFWRKSRTRASLSKLQLSFFEEVSHQSFVSNFKASTFIFRGSLAPELGFQCFNFHFSRKPPTRASFSKLQLSFLEEVSHQSFVSRMRSKGSRFTLGLGVEGVFARRCVYVRNRLQPSATVGNRPRDPRMAVPMVSSAKGVTFGGFTCGVASFRVAGVALRDIQTCLVTRQKSFCVAGAILLRRFQKMRCSFRCRRSTLDVSIVILRGRRSTLDVSCCVFFANRIARAASSGDKVQIPWQAWRFVRCDEN